MKRFGGVFLSDYDEVSESYETFPKVFREMVEAIWLREMANYF